MAHARPLVLLAFELSCLLVTQEASSQLQTGNVHVYVTFLDDRAPTEQLKVGLISGANSSFS